MVKLDLEEARQEANMAWVELDCRHEHGASTLALIYGAANYLKVLSYLLCCEDQVMVGNAEADAVLREAR